MTQEPKRVSKPGSIADLFDLEENLSPRVLWCRRHGVQVQKPDYAPPGRPWEARVSFASEHKEGTDEWMIDWALHARSNRARFGSSKDEALSKLAKALGVESHQEEQLRLAREVKSLQPKYDEFEDGF